MKYVLPLLLAVALSACKSDPEVQDPQDELNRQREALVLADGIGIYRNGEPSYLFDKKEHQLSVNPSQLAFRIQDDTGAKYVEVVLDAIPAVNVPVRLTLKNNVGLTDAVLEDVVLLRSEQNGLWLWSDQAHTGVVLPRFGF